MTDKFNLTFYLMKTNIPNLEIIGKETHYETDKGFILDNWDFGPDSLHESTSEDINPVFAWPCWQFWCS